MQNDTTEYPTEATYAVLMKHLTADIEPTAATSIQAIKIVYEMENAQLREQLRLIVEKLEALGIV